MDHAQICFAMARKYANMADAARAPGAQVPPGAGIITTPGALPVPSSLEISSSLSTVVASTVAEGCVNEAISALEARARLSALRRRKETSADTDDEAEAALVTIWQDEAGHAELAYRTVAWAMGRTGKEGDKEAGVEKGAETGKADTDPKAVNEGGERGGRVVEETESQAMRSAVIDALVAAGRSAGGGKELTAGEGEGAFQAAAANTEVTFDGRVMGGAAGVKRLRDALRRVVQVNLRLLLGEGNCFSGDDAVAFQGFA